MRARVDSGPPAFRLHRGGSFRRRLALAFGQDESVGDALWRRLVHGAGAFVLVYFVLPNDFFVLLPKEAVLLLALAAVVVIEVLRLGFGLEVPTLRDYEAHRLASYVFYSVGLVVAVLLLPEGLACAVVLGTALVDPLAGELRAAPVGRFVGLGVPVAAYAALAVVALWAVGRWPVLDALALGLAAAVLAVAVERWRFRWLDDDLTMTLAPAALLYGVGVLALGLPR